MKLYNNDVFKPIKEKQARYLEHSNEPDAIGVYYDGRYPESPYVTYYNSNRGQIFLQRRFDSLKKAFACAQIAYNGYVEIFNNNAEVSEEGCYEKYED